MKYSRAQVVILHGAYGHPEENWFGWLRRELVSAGICCTVPSFPTPHGQSLARWLSVLEHTREVHWDSNTILIGHSLGAVCALRWLEQRQIYIRAAILASVFIKPTGIDKFDRINTSFFAEPFLWNEIKPKAQDFILFHGDNDPYVSQSEFQMIAQQLSAKKIVISNGGHLNAAAGYNCFPHIWIQLEQLLR